MELLNNMESEMKKIWSESTTNISKEKKKLLLEEYRQLRLRYKKQIEFIDAMNNKSRSII